MLKPFVLPALLLAAGPAAADVQPAEAAVAEARIQLAAARLPGDPVSDAYLAKILAMRVALGSHDRLEPALVAELDAARKKLQARADAAMPDEPVLLSTLSGCFHVRADVAACRPTRERLAALAGGNGYYHFMLMTEAGARGDDAAFEHHAREVLAAPRFESDFVPVFAALYERYRDVPDALWDIRGMEHGPKATAGITAMAMAAAIALPSYQLFIRSCDGDGGERRELCRDVALTMAEEGTTHLERGIAIAVLRKTGGPAELARADALERETNWLTQGAARIDTALDDQALGQYFDVFIEEGEFAAFRFANQALGRPVTPPADWQP